MEVIVKPNKKYDNDWMPAIPKNWDLKKTTWVFEKIGSGTTPKSENPEYYDNGDINWILTGDLNDSYLKSTSKKVTQKALEDFSTLKIYPRNSLVIAMYGATIGKIALTDIDACTNQACCVLSKPINSNTKFYFYWFLANRQHIISLGYGGGQPNISQEIIKSLRLPCPPITEQKKIVTFLDQKCARIDDLIEKKHKLVELKKEERTALINQAVTKGLDPNIPMKDSGIEWLGEIPEHWEVKRLKYVSMVQPSNVDKKSNEGELSVLLCNYVDVYMNEIIDNSITFMNATANNNEIEKFKLIIDDVLITKDSETPDDIAVPALVKIEKDNLLCGYHLAQIRSNKSDLNGEYLFRLFQSKAFNKNFSVAANGITRFGLGVDSIKNVVITLPPVPEQIAIATHIHRETGRIDAIIEKTQKQIELLKEYKTTLISEAVTGKIIPA